MELKLTDIGTAITESDIQKAETEMNLTFPEDYKRFLLKNNGGIPEEDIEVNFIEIIPEMQETREQGCDIQFFSELNEIPDFYNNLRDEEVIPPKYISVASDSFGNEILLCTDESENYGKVYFGCHELYDPKTNYLAMSLIADSFTEFLEKLEPMEM